MVSKYDMIAISAPFAILGVVVGAALLNYDSWERVYSPAVRIADKNKDDPRWQNILIITPKPKQ
mgnify:CR=1 FL=1